MPSHDIDTLHAAGSGGAARAVVPHAVAPRCVSIDLEVGIRDQKIHAFAGVRGDTDAAYVFQRGELLPALGELDQFAREAAFVLGHNFIGFDRAHLRAVSPGLQLLQLPVVDTLCLNPLAFPRNPYHHLVKHYQDGKLQRGQLNDPELDARLTLDVFRDQLLALQDMARSAPDLLAAWHWLTTLDTTVSGLNAFFTTIRRQPRPGDEGAAAAIARYLQGQGCATEARACIRDARALGWPLAYALAWLSVSGSNSVMPPWVRRQYPQAGRIVRRLRDTRCGDPACAWCDERHDACKELKRWFGFDAFRPQPEDEHGRPLQQTIVESAMAGRHVLGILPTGTGKSLCYQIPALSRYDKTGALTVVISPLVALMADQVAGLEARGIGTSAAINDLLSLPERAEILDRVRLGDVGILIIAPEQLRSKAVRSVLAQREIGMWVLDEAHCISKWGQDFRPDYRYVGRFIRESAQDGEVPPILCLTATAKPEVVQDMVGYFRDRVGVELLVLNGGAKRDNLAFDFLPITPAEKFARVHQVLRQELPDGAPGGAIVYCASRKQTEQVAEYLEQKGVKAGFFHAGLPSETKKATQQRFIAGQLQVIAATNAFGMGIDKPDVRLVIHADMPGSLENYLQEAGRAGRDRLQARCVLLYCPPDVERQFGMSARSRLTQREIQSVLRALRTLERKKKGKSGDDGEVIATSAEILAEDSDGAFERDSATDDTRVRTAVSWLEEAGLLTREENHVQVFPSSLMVGSIEAARARLAGLDLFDQYRKQLLALVQAMLGADADQGISTDELMGISGLSSDKLRAALYDLERLGIASNDTLLTAFVHAAVVNSSQKRLDDAIALEVALVKALREAAPDMGRDDSSVLHLRQATQALKDAGHPGALPEKIVRLLGSLAGDGRSEDGGTGSIRLRRLDAETIQVTLQRDWNGLEELAGRRRQAAVLALRHLLAALPAGVRGTDLLAETSLGKLHAALKEDVVLMSQTRDSGKLLDRALLWLHEQEAIRLNKGLAVFRPAMTIRLSSERRGFVKADFMPLKLHYDEQVVQIHVMAEYVRRGLEAVADALRLVFDYFRLERDEFLRIWLPVTQKELERQTTPASWNAIVESLNNPVQQKIVADDREQTNVLVLAGPGSGKTRVLVHRIAYLVRVRRENPHGILALAYNRHAAVEIRRRLEELIGNDARGVMVMTCHAFAMRLTGTSFRKQAVKDDIVFKEVMRDAVGLLQGDGSAPEEADEQRDRLLGGFRWVLVDEYQDIGPDQYALISAIAGRGRPEDDGRPTLFAVGDDDQNIYAFDGASVEFIRAFETDYLARASYLVENYRSSRHIVDAANLVIAPAGARMKAEHPIRVDKARLRAPAGGAWQDIDPVGQGRVQVLRTGEGHIVQAAAIMEELRRLAALAPGWNWARAAVIGRDWKSLEPVRAWCELHGIPVQMADEEGAYCWQLRETRQLLAVLRAQEGELTTAAAIGALARAQGAGAWWDVLGEAVEQYRLETAGAELPRDHFIEWLADWGRELRRRQAGLLLLTAHRAKGLEFDHVAVLDGGWQRSGATEDADAVRRLFYVAMTRARQTLMLADMEVGNSCLAQLGGADGMVRRTLPAPVMSPELGRRYLRLTPRDVFLDFAGRCRTGDPVHTHIAALSAGAQLRLKQAGDRWELCDMQGRSVGRLAQSFSPPYGMHCVAAGVHAVIQRRRKDVDPAFEAALRCDEWEVILPELVFAALADVSRAGNTGATGMPRKAASGTIADCPNHS
ncbi:RecQ family ATP-dependent DNA helicase [Massilia arenae]|uniref:DNA 3'-5' helicase n=1 Tax=Massilia arenae TaxID=2603288 RepID=A0A5C7G489_9BURK|nr:RecQ family ATP-dependent DNA helicase [Massilia arenae]TXG00175.1 RecQ family ATP-dependent DNA helicase [Massilia arenae]